MNRRLFLTSSLAVPLLWPLHAAAQESQPPTKGVFVPAGKDRGGAVLKIWGIIPLEIKIATADSGGALFAFEHADMGKGGPPRHFHHDQDEWFYATKGEFAFEVGDEKFRLRAGDSLFAPRKVPHVWACVSDTPGTLLLALNPAGTFETYIREAAKLTSLPSEEDMNKAFAAHEMKVVGPPLKT
ncbi:MAG: cupin domain-containing protein [Phycisphaerae bacterium]